MEQINMAVDSGPAAAAAAATSILSPHEFKSRGLALDWKRPRRQSEPHRLRAAAAATPGSAEYANGRPGEDGEQGDEKDGLGALRQLGDESVLCDELLPLLDAVSLVRLGACSRPLYVVCCGAAAEDLWKTLCVRECVTKDKLGEFTFKGCWRRTLLLPRSRSAAGRPLPRISLHGAASVSSYKHWYRGHVPLPLLEPPALLVAGGGGGRGIDRRHRLSVDEFRRDYETTNRPVVISGLLDSWPARQRWLRGPLLERYGRRWFKTNGTDDRGRCFKLRLADYFAYCDGNADEKPLYLFDNRLEQRAPELLGDYTVPEHFRDDLFDYMPAEDRPDWRWLLIGPPRSGSTLHQDPHRTSAWNALLSGRKRWVLYPPDFIPPGVDETLIDSEYYAAPDALRWFLEHYPRLRPEQRPLEIVQQAGEVIFVPSGWWHAVLNLDETVAITQNFCSPRNFAGVYADLRDRPANRTLLRDFVKHVRPARPELDWSLCTTGAHGDDESSSADLSSSSDSSVD